jgi:hypothetical protein
MKDIVLLDCDEIGCPKVLMYVFIELCEAFKNKNYNIKIINSINDITNDCIVFMGDIFNHKDPVTLLNKVAPDAIYIGWYWHNINTAAFKYFIHTYENMLNPDERVRLLKQKIANCPLFLRASENPELVGKYEKKIVYDYCYMGWRYCPEFVPSDSFNGIYHGVFNHDEFFPYSKRKEIYLSSIFALGFQGSENIENKHVSQIIFEGLAYGCIVLSNSIPACEQTNNIVVYINSKQDLENKMKYFKENPYIIKQKQEEGYEFIRKYGTNYYSIDAFIKCANEVFDIVI